MQQRDDCGCGKTRAPTLNELLNAARAKRLPTIRSATAPEARLAATLSGYARWSLVDANGRTTRRGEGPNIILDQGLDEIASTEILAQAFSLTLDTYFPIIQYAAVGTDNTAPNASQAGLGTEVGRTNASYEAESITRTSPGVYEITRYIEFDYAEANGNLTEWGFSSSESAGSNLFNRALFLDGGGSPDVVTKTSDYKLRIAYTLEITLSPVSLTPGSFTVTNVGTVNGDYMLIGEAAPTSRGQRCKAPDLVLFSTLARGELEPLAGGFVTRPSGSFSADDTDRSGITYTSVVDTATGNTATVVSEERDAYTPGSFTRTGGAWKFETGDANLDPIRAFFINGAGEVGQSGSGLCMAPGYVFDLDLADEFTKDNEHTLTIGVPTVTWGRGS